jgi:hypothetical protein
MSEKIYAWLLRLFPSRFRNAYGEDALQLFRDRSRDESGFFPTLRLWLDLLADLAVSVPREHFHAQPALVAASARRRLDGTPSFQILEDGSPRPEALFSAAVLSLVAFVAIPVLIGQDGTYRARRAWSASTQHPYAARSSAFRRHTPQPTGNPETNRSARNLQLASASSSVPVSAELKSFQSNQAVQSRAPEIPQSQTPHPKPQDATVSMTPAVDKVAKLDPAERQRVIDAAIANLRQHYAYPDVAQKMADALLAHQKSGDDDAVTDGGAFANLLTKQMRDVSPDRHLVLVYSRDPLPQNPAGPTAEDLARYRKALEQQDCTFEKVAILPRNIGYLKLNSFPDPSACRPTATAARASQNHADAIIFDLRDNRGGEPAMVALMAAYLFDHPEYWYNPRENTTEQSWTRSPVPGNRLADKLVYVLTSARTLSGAEQFCYDLKMLKRATLIGETTGGAAHSGVFHRIDDHFGMGIPETKPINPFSKTDWAETGVDPDIKVKPADALETALKLAETKLPKN